MEWEEIKKENWSLRFFLNGLKTLWELLENEKKNMFLVVVFIVIMQMSHLSIPYLLKLIFDELPKVLSERRITNSIFAFIALMIAIRFSSLVINHFVKEPLFLKIAIRLENLWPAIAHKKLLSLSLGFHEKENTGRKIAKIQKGCERLIEILGNLVWNLLPSILYLTINMAVILIMDWKLGILFLLPFAPAIILHNACYKRFAEKWEQWEEKKEISMGMFCQSLINIQTVQNYVQEQKESRSFQAVRKDMETIDATISLQIQKYFFVIGMILQMGFILTIIAGIYFVFYGKSTVGTVIYIIATGNVTTQNLWEIFNVYMKIMRNLFAVIRLKELLDCDMSIKNAPDASVSSRFLGNFEFQNITFAYPEKTDPIFQDFTLKFPSNKMIALVSKSGEGKTTLVRLLCRMYDLQAGKILLDGRDIRTLDLYWYRRLFAMVQQEIDIFDATIKENVAYAVPEVSDKEIEEALHAAHLEIILSDIEKFPHGIRTMVGEQGVRLSGGEKQRVGIARAYLALKNGARVLILDEATSHLDSEAERAIQKMIEHLRKERNISIVAIAHRLSTIKKADAIYVISNGKIAEQGDHRRLMEKNGLYSRLVELQQLGELRR